MARLSNKASQAYVVKTRGNTEECESAANDHDSECECDHVMQQLKAISILTSVHDYLYRAQSINCLGDLADVSILICKSCTSIAELGPVERTKIIVPERQISGIRFYWWAANKAIEIMRRDGRDEDWHVMENVTGYALFFLRFCLRSRAHHYVLLVAPCFTFLKSRAWNSDQFAQCTSWLQSVRHCLMWLRRCVGTAISIAASDVIVANSEAPLTEVNTWTKRKKKYVVANAVKHFEEPQSLKRHSDPFILVVGSRAPHKGVGFCFEVLSRLTREGHRARLVMAGSLYSRDRRWFETTLADYSYIGDRIDIKDRLPRGELAKLYCTADVLLFASANEGSPRCVLEALAHGCPVVSTDIPGVRTLDPLGQCVLYFPIQDVDICVHRLLKVLNSTDVHSVRARSTQLAKQLSPVQRAARIAEIYRMEACKTLVQSHHDSESQ